MIGQTASSSSQRATSVDSVDWSNSILVAGAVGTATGLDADTKHCGCGSVHLLGPLVDFSETKDHQWPPHQPAKSCMVITYNKSKDQPGKVANLARGELNRENE